jgi:hypothetical protein
MSNFSDWLSGILQPLVKSAVDEAVADLSTEIKGEITALENNLVGQITQLPGLVASQIGHVAVDAEQVAQQVAQEFGQFINPSTLAQNIVQGVISSLHIPNVFGEHETTSGTAKPPSKADQIRQKLDEKKGKK